MPRGRGGHHQPPRRPVDLTGVISLAEKNDLVTLVNAITEKIHKDVGNMFDSPPVTALGGQQSDHHGLFRSMTHHGGKENLPPPSQPSSMTIGDGSSTYIKTHQVVDKEEQESLTPQLRELKKEALLALRKWQSLVVSRMRDLVVTDSVMMSTNGRGRGRGVRGSPVRGRGGRVSAHARGLTHATGSYTSLCVDIFLQTLESQTRYTDSLIRTTSYTSESS
jgi:hypothetical protein